MRAPKKSFAERRAERAAIDDPAVVLDAALRFLEARQRSVDEVRRRLATAGYQPDLVGGAIDRLSELGMLDDEEFARQWVESRDRARPRGERALRRELAMKGIDRSVSDAVLEARGTPGEDGRDVVVDADAEAARRLLERNGRSLLRVADLRARRQRAYALLARNGFDGDTIGDAIASAEAEWGVDGSDASPE